MIRLKTINFKYQLTSESLATIAYNHDGRPTHIKIDIITMDFPTPTKIGNAQLYLYDLHEINLAGLNIKEEMNTYSTITGKLANLIINTNGSIRRNTIKSINRSFQTNIQDKDIRRIALILRRTTIKDFKGNHVTDAFYKDIFKTLSPDLVFTYPFPLQFENSDPRNTDKPKQFISDFLKALRKLKSIYKQAGMKEFKKDWMVMVNPRFIH